LCPACGADSVRILTSVEVSVDVVVDATEEELRVIDEALGDAAWDEKTAVACRYCDWHGTVGDLHQHVLTEIRVP
ncbi:MAG: hypothetical protein P8Y13_05395, partial [Deinococcales bacterium]